MPQQEILMGNQAIGRGLIEAGVQVMTAYPGTPSSEILPAVVAFGREIDPPPYVEWSVNEKVALEVALAAAYTGKRTACAMKQVGLNVALDPVMSAAYIGVIGGMVIISADDPGPHSSQTEQDSRLLAHFAKLPVLDPDSPAAARDLAAVAFEYSERFELPVMLRPTLRVCHARQSLTLKPPLVLDRPARFPRDPFRWAAIPKQRLALHQKLNDKLARIAQVAAEDERLITWRRPAKRSRLGILASGIAAALARDVLAEMGLMVEEGNIPFLEVALPFPLPVAPVAELVGACDKVLVLEETEPVLELLAPGREKLLGRLSGHVPSAGELTPDRLGQVLEGVLGEMRLRAPKPRRAPLQVADQAPLRRPNLCPGCGHRAVFWAMKRTFPQGIFPGDIGCYTLGMNQGAVDTCHDMGASVNFGAALARAHQMDGREVPVVATIGDSTFYHSGPAGLINAVYNGARFVLVISDNETTSMTGMQPTPENGLTADGHPGRRVDLMGLIRGCGVEQVEEVDPYDLPALMRALRKARRFAAKADGAVAVVVARHACAAQKPRDAVPNPLAMAVATGGTPAAPVFDQAQCANCGRCLEICPRSAISKVGDGLMAVEASACSGCRLCAAVCPTGAMSLEPAGACVACGLCRDQFNCPGLIDAGGGAAGIDPSWCVGCGLCVEVCQHGAITAREAAA